MPSGVISTLPDTDWVKHSLEGLAPVVAGRFFLHGSHDRERRRHGGVPFEIDAGTAFGTGHHGTTAGCLLALDAILKRRRPERILDLGCGTGVLAIAAALAAKRKTLASDIDPEAVRVTELNAKLNSVAPLLQSVTAPGLKHTRIAHGAPYDLIFGNILARPLISLAQGLTSILAPGGNLVLSGLTRDQARWVLAAYRNRGLIPTHTLLLSNWATLILASKRKRPKHFRAGRSVSSAADKGWEEA
jgi:ribosomal protein L11 methyltransferase